MESRKIYPNISFRLRCITEPPIKKKYKPWLPSPPSLIELAGNVVNNLPLPDCWKWEPENLAKWLRNALNLPDYRDCLIRNYINGRRFMRIDASTCPKIGIRNFADIKQVMQGRRKLFGIEKEKYNRCISLPKHYPWTHHLLYQGPTGPIRENTTATRLFKKMGILDKENICPLDHWETMDPGQPDFPCNRFGSVYCARLSCTCTK